MKSFEKLFLATVIAIGCSAAIVSCHDHDEVCSDATNNTTETNDYSLTAEALQNLLYQVTDLDTLPTGWEREGYSEPTTYGIVADSANPRVRYVEATCRQDAIDFYTDLTGQDEDNYVTAWSHDSIGTVILNTDSTSLCYGSVSVNVKQLTDVDEFRFVPKEALGKNASDDWTQYYHFGDVLKFTPNSGGDPEYWICIRGEWNTKNNGHKEYSYWVCFTLANENVVSVSNDIKYPKDLGGKSNMSKLKTLPQLLAIITDWESALSSWYKYAEKNDIKYSFLGKPVTQSDYKRADFQEIYNAWHRNLSNNVGTTKFTKVIPSMDDDVAAKIMNRFQIVLLSHGPSYSSMFNKLKFSKCLRYTGNGFYTNEKEFSFSYKIRQQNPFNVCDRVLNTSINKDQGFYETVITDESNTVGKEGVYFFVRIVRSDKLPGINPSERTGKKGLNHGEMFTSSTHTIQEYIKVNYDGKHEK